MATALDLLVAATGVRPRYVRYVIRDRVAPETCRFSYTGVGVHDACRMHTILYGCAYTVHAGSGRRDVSGPRFEDASGRKKNLSNRPDDLAMCVHIYTHAYGNVVDFFFFLEFISDFFRRHVDRISSRSPISVGFFFIAFHSPR